MKLKALIRSHLIITFGILCSTFGWSAFLLPSHVSGGGVSGLSAVLYFATGIPAGLLYLLINTVLIVIAAKMMGVAFATKSVLGVIIYSVLLSFLQSCFHAPLVADVVLATVIGAILTGFGTGVIFTQGGSAGGTDLVAMTVSARRNISPSRVIMTIDVVVISSSFLLFHSVEKVIYGYCIMAISSYVIDFVLTGNKQSYQLMIVSNHYAEIADKICERCHRGVTLIDAEGWYSKHQTKIVMVIVRKFQVTEIFRIVKESDPQAFMSMGNVMGVYGKGFETVKV